VSIKNKGFSLIEVILAIAIFAIITNGGIANIIGVLGQNRQSGEIIKANNLAQEGLEAVRSIGNRDFNLLTSGTKGIGVSSNLWTFDGTSDITDKYTRQILISPISRDTYGTLVSSDGTIDSDTWLVKSTVNWNYSIGDIKQFSLETILTNWKRPIISVNYDALTVYSNSTTSLSWRTFTNSSNTFGTETTLPAALSGTPRSSVIKTSPKKIEAIAGTITSSGVLYIYCFDGNTWTQDWSVTVGGSALTRRFDIAYETNSGKAVVLYSTNTGTTNELNFRTKNNFSACGSGWSSATNYNPLRTSGVVQWVKMTSDPRSSSNTIAALWADSASDLSASIWNGTTFANEPAAVTENSLEVVNISQDVDDFDLEYESLSGDLMLVWANSSGANNTNGVRYRTCTGGTTTCTWNTITTPPTFSDDATNLDLSSNPNSNEMVFASIGNDASDMQAGYWSGTAWTNNNNVDNSCETPLAGTKLVATGWLNSGATSRSIVVYNDNNSNNLGWFTGNGGSFNKETDSSITPNFTDPQKWYEINVNPKSKDQLMFTVSDNSSDLFAKRLAMTATPSFVWTNSDGGTALETTLSQSTSKSFGFAYWQ